MPTYYAPGTRRGNKTWVVRGHVAGEQYEIRPEKARNKREAEKAWQDFAADTRRDQRDANRTRETATFDWACDEYLTANPDVGETYAKNVRALKDHFYNWPLVTMTTEDIYMAAAKICGDVKPQTKNARVITPAAAVLHYMARRRMCEHFVIPKLTPRDVRRPITYPEQLAILIDAADPELAAILTTLQIHGWRITEVLNIEEKRIDWQRSQIERWVSKSREWRWAVIDREVLALWKALPKRKDGYIFALRKRHDLYYRVDCLIKELGLKMKYRPHNSRRGLATTLRDLGYGIDDIRDAAQWQSSQSAAVYVKDDPERIRPVFEKVRAAIGAKPRKVAE
jgi:integrase